MATFRRRMGKWEVRVRRYNNKTISKTFIQKEDAHKWARETETQIEKGLYEDLSQANTITLSELMQTYYRDVTVTKLGHSQEKYKIDKLCRQPIAKLKLAKLTPMQIRKFQDQCLLIYNPSTTNKYITLISVAIKHARTMLGIYLPSNPCDFIKRLKEPEFKADIIEPEEEILLLTEAERSKANWLKLAIMLGVDCGMRRGEIIKLRRENVNFKNATATLLETKNGTSRSIGLSPRVIGEMRKLPINIDGRVINCPSNDNFQHFYSQLQRWTGVKKSFHTTRHTFASRCAMNGWSIAEISAQGGWKNLSILKRYTHIKATYLSEKLAN